MNSKVKAALVWIAAAIGVAVPIAVWTQFAYLEEFFWPDSLYEWGQGLSLVGFVLLFYQFVLAGRNRFFERALGLDRLITAHRWLGVFAVLFILLHAASITIVELTFGALTIDTGRLIGIIALTILVVTLVTAIVWKSIGWTYEQWKRIHYANYVVLPAGFVHALMLGSTVRRSDLLRYYLIALTAMFGLVVLARIVKRMRMVRNPLRVAEVVRENHDVTSLHLEGKKPDFLPGQFLFLKLQNGSGWSEQHPFTISSSPTDPFLRVSAKASGDFSTTLREYESGKRALVEAPYGVFSYTGVPSDKLVFVAGGIGITPFLSHLRHMRVTGTEKQVRMIWGNKTQDDFAFTEELDAAAHDLNDFKLIHVLSMEEWDGERGYVTAELVQRHVDNPADWHYLVCGPRVMMKAVFRVLKELNIPGSQVHHERFALG